MESNLSEEDQPYPEATVGGRDMKIQFKLLTGPNSDSYYSIIHPGLSEWREVWINDPDNTNILGFDSDSAMSLFGVDISGSDTKTLNVFWSENDNLLGFAEFPYNGNFGTEKWGCWNSTSTMPGNSGVYGGENTCT